MIKLVLCYGSQIWAIKEEEKHKIIAVVLDYFRRSATVSKLQRIRNDEIRNIATTDTVMQQIAKRILKPFGHILRMDSN